MSAELERAATAGERECPAGGDGDLISHGDDERGRFGDRAARAVIDVELERRAGADREAVQRGRAWKEQRDIGVGLDLDRTAGQVDRGRRDLEARSGEDERRAGGDRERAGALEEAPQLAREDVHRGTLDQHVDAEVTGPRVLLGERRPAVELDHAVVARARGLSGDRTRDRELRGEDLEAGGGRAGAAADAPRRAARPDRVDVALHPAAVAQRERPGDGERAVARDVEVGTVDGQACAVDGGLRAGVGRDDQHRVLRAADRSAARGESARVQLGLVAEGERPAQRQALRVLRVAGGHRDGRPGGDHDRVARARDSRGATAPGRGRRPGAAGGGRAGRSRRARRRDQEEREWERGAQRPALHAAPFHSRRSFLARYIAASARASTVSALSRESATAIPMLTPMLVSTPRRSNGRVERFAQAIRHPAGIVDGVEVLAQDGELVPADARDRVGGARGAAHALRGLPQQLVAGGVPEVVVDALEAIEVDEQHGDPLLGAARALDRVLEPVEEQHAIREARERVVERPLAEPLGGLLLLADVLDLRDEVRRRPGLIAHERDAQENPDVAPVGVQVALLERVRLALPREQALAPRRGRRRGRRDVSAPGT